MHGVQVLALFVVGSGLAFDVVLRIRYLARGVDWRAAEAAAGKLDVQGIARFQVVHASSGEIAGGISCVDGKLGRSERCEKESG